MARASGVYVAAIVSAFVCGSLASQGPILETPPGAHGAPPRGATAPRLLELNGRTIHSKLPPMVPVVGATPIIHRQGVKR